jgi:hypothetical protein
VRACCTDGQGSDMMSKGGLEERFPGGAGSRRRDGQEATRGEDRYHARRLVKQQ